MTITVLSVRSRGNENATRSNRRAALAMLHQMKSSSGLTRSDATGSKVVTINIFGDLSDALEKRVRSGLEEAIFADRILLNFNSHGGTARVGENLADAVAEMRKYCSPRIEAVASGYVESAALAPFLEAEVRRCRRRTQFLLHRTTVDLEHNRRLVASDFEEFAAAMVKFDKCYVRRFRARTRISSKMISRFYNGEDVTFNGTAAFRLGFVDVLED